MELTQEPFKSNQSVASVLDMYVRSVPDRKFMFGRAPRAQDWHIIILSEAMTND
jgi:hypothetical protein